MNDNPIIITLDPSINDIGWCIANNGNYKWGTIRTKGETDHEKLAQLGNALLKLIREYQPTDAVVEKPPHYTYATRMSKQTGRGMNAAAIQKLNMAFGVCTMILSQEGIPTETPLPQEYKPASTRGRMVFCLPSKTVRELMRMQFKNDKINEHEAHAIYMALWKEQRLKVKSMIVTERVA